MTHSSCRFCKTPLHYTFANLGVSPISNDYLDQAHLKQAEKFYPLHAYICEECLLVQLEEFESPEHLFGDGDYAYFSSYSENWLNHSRAYTDLVIERFGLNANNLVIEIASNDGYLLQYFVKQGIPVLGVEPASNVAAAAVEKGVPSWVKFFGVETAKELVAANKRADLLLANNVLAHVPDLNDFVAGMQIVLNLQGIITVEFPHLLRLIRGNQFDTIYHEHFSYFSFLTVEKIFAHHRLTLFDVDELSTHGGSLRIYARHVDDSSHPITERVKLLRQKELEAGLTEVQTYLNFEEQIRSTKRKLLSFLIEAKAEKKVIVGYGAPAKGNTLLNYCGVGTDFLDYTVDCNPHKQSLFLPGTRIPIFAPDRIFETKPDYVLILPWNIKDEIMGQMSGIREWGGKFVTPIPEVQICP